jgi:hypothetical protein
MEDLVDEIFLIVNDLKCESECDEHASEALSWLSQIRNMYLFVNMHWRNQLIKRKVLSERGCEIPTLNDNIDYVTYVPLDAEIRYGMHSVEMCSQHVSSIPEPERIAQQKNDVKYVMVLLDDIRNELIRIDRNVIGMNQIMQKRIEEGYKSSRISRMCSQSTQCPL